MRARLSSWAFLVVILCRGLLPHDAAATPDLTGSAMGERALRVGSSFALNSASVLAAAYFKYDQNLYYLHFADNAWAEEAVKAPATSIYAWDGTQLVFVHGQPHILYNDGRSGALMHAYRAEAGSWTTEVVDDGEAAAEVGTHLSAVDCGGGLICGAYYDSTNKRLKFARGAVGAWQVTVVDDSSCDTGQFTDITLGASGRPIISYLSYCGEGDQQPKVAAELESEEWSIEAVGASGSPWGRWTTIAQGSDEVLHLTAGSSFDGYNSPSDGYFYYAHKPPGGQWSVTTLSTSNTSAHTSIGFLADGRPHLAARYMMRSALFGQSARVYYTWLDAAAHWRYEYLTPTMQFGYFSAINLFSDYWGHPLVAYYFSNSDYADLYVHGPADSDHDLLPDRLEGQFGAADGASDADGDDIADGIEVLRLGTDPAAPDSDSDGSSDATDKDGLDSVAGNLIEDGSCDRLTIDAWRPLANPRRISKQTAVKAQGARSLAIDSGGGGFAGVAQRGLAYESETAYFLRFSHRRISGTLRVRLAWGGDEALIIEAVNDGTSTGWRSYTGSFFTPAGAGDLRLLVDTDGEAYLDGIQLISSSSADADGDGVENTDDNCIAAANPQQIDVDNDGDGDVCDLDDDQDGQPDGTDCAAGDTGRWRLWAYADADGDGIADDGQLLSIACHGSEAAGYAHNAATIDNCVGTPNADQRDTDGDDAGDLCDDDDDGDGTGDGDDCAPLDYIRFQFASYYDDSDGDGFPDSAAAHSGCIGHVPPPAHTLQDSPLDNCPQQQNWDQSDSDGDGTGDVCDSTPDGEPPASASATPTPTPTATPILEEPTPEDPLPPSALLLRATRHAIARSGAASSRIVGSARLDDTARTPAAGVEMSFICNGDVLRRVATSAHGRASLLVQHKRNRQSCRVEAGGYASNAVVIPRRSVRRSG